MTTVYFFHGAFSSPQSVKIGRLKTIAESLGFTTVIPDHSAIREPDKRVADMLKRKPDESCILVGSSMGGYVATVLSTSYKPHGLFLMAPAVFMPATTYEQQNLTPSADHVEIIHGWYDA
ncbi:MAG: YqiA/YcfP family alpha/beta fold hydrolase, partial [Chloroflexota bacterium]